MTVNTECGLLLTYVPTYRNARASEGRRCRACTVWSPLASSGGHPRRAACTVDAAQHADARRRVARVRAPVSRPPPRFKGAQARAQARAQGLRRELRASGASSGSQLALQLFPGAARTASHRGRTNPRAPTSSQTRQGAVALLIWQRYSSAERKAETSTALRRGRAR